VSLLGGGALLVRTAPSSTQAPATKQPAADVVYSKQPRIDGVTAAAPEHRESTAAASATIRAALAAAPPGSALTAGPGYVIKARLFNLLLQRHLYALATRNPWVSV